MSTATAVEAATRTAAMPPIPTINDTWILTVPLNDPWDVELTGGEFAARGGLKAFFEGLLVDRTDLADSVDASHDQRDADLLLLGYEKWGQDVFPRLRGSFTAVIVDRTAGSAFVARDPFGSHPLFMTRRGRRVSFATAARTLVALPDVSSGVNRGAIVDHMCHRWSFRHETLFDAVTRVPQGWLATIRQGSVATRRYWDPVPAGQPIDWLPESEIEKFDEQLDRAVDRCLRAGPSAIFLSGGLDSISIAAVAADRARRCGYEMPRALSLAFPEPCSEGPVQSGVAQSLGLSQTMVSFDDAVGPRGLLQQALELSPTLSSPILNTWLPAYSSLARTAQIPGLQTIMTGSGGDEWLGASPFLMADLIRGGHVVALTRFLQIWKRSFRQSWPKVAYSGLWKFGLRPVGSMWLHRLAPSYWDRNRAARIPANDPPWVAPEATLRAERLDRAPAALTDADPIGGFYARESRVFLDCAFGSWEAEERYEFGRHLGVRYMHPYWDPDLVTQIYRTPPELLNKGGRAKGLVRSTVARRFPNLGFERQKKVSAVEFYGSLLRTEGPRLAAAVGELKALARLDVIDVALATRALRAAFDEQRPGSIRDMHMAWDLLNLEMWTRAHVTTN